MNDKIFLDSNILVNCYSTSDFNKQSVARALAAQNNTYISTQVINETINVMSKKYQLPWIDLKQLIIDFDNNFIVQQLSTEDIMYACSIADRYQLSFFDSLILASAIKSQCSIIYSEDMQHTQIIDKTIKIINPFV